jgi:hypothetical protein
MMTCLIGVAVAGPGDATTVEGGVLDEPPPEEEQPATANATADRKSRRYILLTFPIQPQSTPEEPVKGMLR